MFDFTGKTSFQPEVDLLAKAKSHTHTLTSGVSHSSDKCALHTKEQESLHELYLLIHSLKESIHSKCNLNVHVKFHRMKSASRYTDYTKVYHNSTENQGFQAQSHHINIPPITLKQLFFKRFSL